MILRHAKSYAFIWHSDIKHKPFFGGFSLSESIHLSFGSSYNCSIDAEMSSTCGSTLHASTRVRVLGEQGQCSCSMHLRFGGPEHFPPGGVLGQFHALESERERERERERQVLGLGLALGLDYISGDRR